MYARVREAEPTFCAFAGSKVFTASDVAMSASDLNSASSFPLFSLGVFRTLPTNFNGQMWEVSLLTLYGENIRPAFVGCCSCFSVFMRNQKENITLLFAERCIILNENVAWMLFFNESAREDCLAVMLRKM